MYRTLVNEIKQLPDFCKTDMLTVYHAFSDQQKPIAADFTRSLEHGCYLAHEAGEIHVCFGCCQSPTEHQLIWPTGIAYAWCIWDAFFIARLVGKPVRIETHDPVDGKKLLIDFDGSHFECQAFYFSFPVGDALLSGKSLRSCFCCRTKAFSSLDNARHFSRENAVEIIDLDEMLRRTDAMVAAFSPHA